MQAVTTHGDEEIVQAEALIAAFIKDEEQIKKVTAAALDLADAKQMSLGSAADLITKSISSSTNAMSRYGIEIEGTAGSSERLESAINAINKAFGGQAEALAKSDTGKLTQLKNTLSDIEEKMGGFSVSASAPFIGTLKETITVLDDINPNLTGMIATLGTLTFTFGLLKTTGLMPLIGNFTTFRASLQMARVHMALASAEGQIMAGRFTVAGMAVKGFFASLGPVGWAIIAITALTTAVSILSNSTEKLSEEEKQAINSAEAERIKFGQLTKAVLDETKSMNERNNAKKEAQKLYPEFLANIDLEKTKHAKLNEEVYKSKIAYEDLIKTKLLNKQLDLAIDELAKLKNEGVVVDFWDSVLYGQNAVVKKTADYVDELVKAEAKVNDLAVKVNNLGSGNKGDDVPKLKAIVGLYAEIDNKIKELNDKKATAKTIAEIVEIENKINELTREKKVIEFKVDLQKGGGALDVSNLKAKGSEIEVPKTMKPLDVASDYEELNAMKFAIIEDGYQRESDMIDAKYQADLVKYKDVIGAKEILDADYTKKKEELDKASAEAQVQGTIDALNFIATAVAEHTVAGKAIAVANATWNTYKAANSALAEIPPPFNFVMAGLVTAAGLANVAKIVGITAEPPKKFEHGGRFKKGESGFIEGYHNEIIAPEKTFIEVFQKELRPQIYANSSVGNTAVVDTRGIQATIQAELAKFTSAMENKHWAIKGEDIATSNRRYSERRERNSF